MQIKMREKIRRHRRPSCRQRFWRLLWSCLLLFCFFLAVWAGEGYFGSARTVHAEETSEDKADMDRPSGETQVSAWVEAAGEADGDEPEEDPDGAGTEEEQSDGTETGQGGTSVRNRVRTGDPNGIVIPALLLLGGGTVMIVQKVRNLR